VSDVPIVLALPPYAPNGEERDLLVDQQALYGGPYLWRCRFRKSSPDPYKWHVLEGPPVRSFVDVQSTTTSTTYANPTSGVAGPDLPLPAAGLYDVVAGAVLFGSGDAVNVYMSYNVGSAAALDVDAVRRQSNGSGYYHGPIQSRPRRQVISAAGTTLAAKMKVGNLTGYFELRWLEARPVRLGPG
jgi:hypothetical protein